MPGYDDSHNGFTQNDINSGFVKYCHHNHSLMNDTFHFQLHSTNLWAESGNFTIAVVAYETLPQPNILFHTNVLSVVEGRQAVLSSETLVLSLAKTIRVPWTREKIKIRDMGIVFHIENAPRFGSIFILGDNVSVLEFSLDQVEEGSVVYSHDGSENHKDLVSVSIEMRGASHLPIRDPILPLLTNLSIVVDPVNNYAPSIEVAQITPDDGRFVKITTAMINIVDRDRPPETITLLLLNQDTDYGYFEFENTAGVPIQNFTTAGAPLYNFTMSDVHAGRVIFVHLLNPLQPLNSTVTFQASDGEHTTHGVRGCALHFSIKSAFANCSACIYMYH